MPSAKDSDDDFEENAAGRLRTQLHTIQSPLRRSTRLKQNKYSPGSESDSSSVSNSCSSSVSNSRSSRTRTATMNSTVSDTVMKLRPRKLSVSSDISEIDVEILQTSGKRITRQSLNAPATPTRVNTRAASKRFTRATSEVHSPLPLTRTRRSARASSVDPESSDKNKDRPETPVKTRRRASMLSSSSLAKEQLELKDRIPYVRLDATIVEADEITSSGNSDSSLNKASHLPKSLQIKKRQSMNKEKAEPDDSHGNSDSSPDKTLHLPKRPQIKKRQNIDKDEAEADDSHENSDSSPDETLHLLKSQKIKKRESIDKDEAEDDNDEKLKTSTDSSKDEAFQLLEREDETQAEDMDSATVKNTDNTLAGEEDKLGKCPSSDNSVIEICNCSSNSSGCQSFAKEDQTKIAEENPSNVEKSIEIRKLEVPENEFEKLLDTSTEEQKSDKENEMLNINSDVSVEKNMQPMISSIKSLASPFMNKSLNEKETKSMKKELSRRRRSRESVEIKYDNSSKKVADDSQEKMDISIEILNSTTNATVLSQHDIYLLDGPKLVEKVINKDETSSENINKSTTEISCESVKINEKEYTVIDNKNSHKIESDKMSRSSINLAETQIENKDNKQSRTSIPTTDENNEIRLEKQNPRQDENEVPSPCKSNYQSEDMQISSPANENSDIQDENEVPSPCKSNYQSEDMQISSPANENSDDQDENQVPSSCKSNYQSEDMQISSPANENSDDQGENEIPSPCKSTYQSEDMQISSLANENSDDQGENEVPSPCKSTYQSEDMQISSPANKNSDDQIITQDKVTDTSIREKQEQQDLSKCTTKLPLEFSNTTLKSSNSVRNDSNNVVIQDDQSSDVIEISKKSRMDLSPEKTDAKDILPEKIMKRNLKRNSTDVLDDIQKEKESSQMELCQKYLVNNIEISDDSDDVEGFKSLFQNLPVDGFDKREKKIEETKKKALCRAVTLESHKDVCVNKSPLKRDEDIIIIKATRNVDEGYDFELASDDERFMRNRLDAARKKTNIKKLDVVDEELMGIDNEEIENRLKKQKERIYRRITTLDEESFECIEEEDNSKTVNELKTSLNDRKTSGLNKSEQLTRTSERSFKTNNESDKEIEDDTTKLNRSSLINKKNTSLRSVGERTSTNNFSRDTSMQNASANKSQIDDSEEELDNTDAGKKLYKKKRSLSKSRKEDTDVDAIDSEKTVSTKDSSQINKNTLRKFLNRSIDQKSKPDTKTTLDLHANKSDSDISTGTTNLGSKTSMTANVGSYMSDEDSSDENNCYVRLYRMKTKCNIDSSSDTADNRNNSDDNSIDSDINKEYNLNGVDPKYDYIPGHLCRASETESSDSNDNGSDLADFIVDDVEDEGEKEEDMEDKESGSEQDVEDEEEKEEDTEDKESGNEQDVEDVESTHENKVEDENKFTGTKRDISDKIHEDRNKSLSCKSNTEMERNKMTSRMEKNTETILDSSNSKMSSKKKKKKSLTKENDTILLDASNLISSSSKKKRKSDPQYSSRDEAERDSNELNELNKSESLSAKKQKSYESMKFSTPIYSSKTLEIDEIFKRISENKDIKLDNANETVQNTSAKKKSSINPTNENIFSNKGMSSNELSPGLLKLLEKTGFSKSTSPKKNSRKTISNADSETPTLKHLRKEKLNDSAPTLKSNIETISTKKLSMEKDTVQIKEKNNKDKVPELIMLSNDDAIQRHSEKRQKKRKKGDTSKENIVEVLSEDLNVPKKIKRVKLTHLSIRDDNLCEDPCQIEEKKKKKKKKQDTSREYIVDEASFENATELKIPKKKKLVKPTQLIVDDNIWEDVCQINEKQKKKKQDTLREYIADKALFEDATELKIPKKKKKKKLVKPIQLTDDNIGKDASISAKKKKLQDPSKKSIIDEALPHDAVVLKIPKIQKRAKLDKLAIMKINTCKSTYEMKEKKKKKEETKKNITEKTLSEDTTELKMPKKKKRANLDKLVIMEDNICKSAYQVEKEKKKKKGKTKEIISEKGLSEDAIELKISKKKKHANLDKLATVQDNAHEDAYQINEKKKKKKKQISVTEEDENMNEDILRKKTRENKTELAQKKKKKVKSIETLWMEKKKKDCLPVQIPVSKLIKISDKNFLSHKRVQKPTLDASESKYIVYTSKKPDKTIAKTYISEELKIPKELKLKRKRIRMEDIENTKKSKKEIKEVTKALPLSRGLKRLPDHVIENLSDVPMRQKKKRKISRNEDQIPPVKKTKSKATTKEYDDSFALSTSGSSTQFHLVNLKSAKKQPLRGTAAAISFRQRMLARNERKPISIYTTYRKKMNLE